MSKVRIVTDSSAHFFDPAFPAKHQVTVVPLTIQFGSTSYQDGVDMDSERFFGELSTGAPIPTSSAPTSKTFASVYEDVCQHSGSVVSIHVSSRLSRTWHNARAGADEVLGRCKIHI